MVSTRRAGTNFQSAGARGAAQAQVVDQAPLATAQQLARLNTSAEEQALAQEALRLADYEVDVAFDSALHEAKEHPVALTGEAKQIADRLQKSQALEQTQQARVQQITAAAQKATGSKKEALEDDLAIAQEDLNLTHDEVEDARQDLIRAGGDPQDRIQEMQKAHKELEGNGAFNVNTAAPSERPGLIYRAQQWWALHSKQMQLWSAKAGAESAAKALSAEHDALDARIEKEKAGSAHLAHHSKKVANPAPSALDATSLTHEGSAALLAQTRRLAADEKALTALQRRVETEKELASVYAQWIGVVAAKQRSVLQRVLIGISIILIILLIGLFFDGWLEKVLGKTSLDRRQIETLRAVTRVSLQVVGVLFVLLVILGPPAQLGTFLGLAGAGLTVALKDFIVGFLGWFVLMGKNGIRLGDWVEINGVTGEVVELGMFHTVLLETGNWTDSSHPTGRRVTFTNSFAIEGHYFNFSTSGQWLWDELHIVVPTGQDPYPIVDAIQKKVLEVTAAGAQLAEREWRTASKSREMSSLTAAPAINIRPVIGGIELAVRYITRANERYQMRAKLYEAAVNLLGQRTPALQERI
jgi:small-conductance mechanosensitive channel